MNYFFTSDTHYGHANIIKYCNRPFKNTDQMNRELIKRHNLRVKPYDTVYHLGDFCFKNKTGRGEGEPENYTHYLSQLNGHHIFIRGNHDNNNSTKTILKSAVMNYGGRDVYLVHNPDDMHLRYDLNFVGHVHGKWKFKDVEQTFLINVGVDVWNFEPVNFKQIIKAYNKYRNKL